MQNYDPDPDLVWLASHLDADLDGLSVAALGVRDALGVVLAVVEHRLLVPGLLLQREDHTADVHVAVRMKVDV